MESPVIDNINNHLRIATGSFITFLYAAAVHIILHAGHEHGLHGSLQSSAALLVIVVFFLTDWLSRTRLPALVHDPASVLAQMVKTVLDLTCLYLLLFSALTFVHASHTPADPKATTTFFTYVTWFLGATFVWNLQMFRIMKDLAWHELVTASITGGALQMEATKSYGRRYLDFRDAIVRIKETGKISLLNTTGGISVVVVGNIIPQLVAIHLSVGNLALGGTLLGHALSGATRPLIGHANILQMNALALPSTLAGLLVHPMAIVIFGGAAVLGFAAIQHVRIASFWRWLLGGAAVLAATWYFPFLKPFLVVVTGTSAAAFIPGVLYMLSDESIESNLSSGWRTFTRYLGSVVLLAEYIILLLVVPPRLVPVIAIVQHFAINIVLQYAATPVGDTDAAPQSTCAS